MIPRSPVPLSRARRSIVPGRFALAVLASLSLGACATLGTGASVPPTASLYARLGGFDALAAITDDFLARVMGDALLTPFFKGLEAPEMQRTRQHLVDLLCSATGGPCFYPGRSMKAVHAEMEIGSDVWNAFTGHLNETVAKFKIVDRERNELVAIVQSLRPAIVNRP